MKTMLGLVVLVLLAGCKKSKGSEESAPLAASEPAVPAATVVTTVPAMTAAAAPNAAPAAAATTASAVEAVAVKGRMTPQVAGELQQLGIATGMAGLAALGESQGALLRAAGTLATHPTALSAVLNNDTVVTAFNGRPDIQQFCRNPAALTPILVYALSSPTAQAFVPKPQTISTIAESKLLREFQKCPAFRTLAARPDTLNRLAAENPAIAPIVNHPNFKLGLEKAKIRQY